jgi:hypothetical protein
VNDVGVFVFTYYIYTYSLPARLSFALFTASGQRRSHQVVKWRAAENHFSKILLFFSGHALGPIPKIAPSLVPDTFEPTQADVMKQQDQIKEVSTRNARVQEL